MKVVSCETHVVATPPPHVGGMYWIFVSLRTDCGIEGVGEVYAATFHPKVMVPAISDVFERCLQGHDPHHVERFFREAYSSGFTQRPDLTMMGIVSGLEMACWDIIGKAAGKPVYELIGGMVNNKLRSYTYLYPKDKNGAYDYNNVELAVECALENKELGFTALKFDPAGPYTAYSGHMLTLEDMDKSATFCRRIREAVGNSCDLLFGTHGQMTPASAIRLAKRLEPYDPMWFEEPVPPGQSEAMSRVAQHTSIPIATGERLTSKYEFHDLLKNGAAASIQLATATPNFLIQESIGSWDGFHAEVLQEKIEWKDGYIIPSDKPGLGIELNMDVVKAYSPYTGKTLHLSMDSKPFDYQKQSDSSWRDAPER